MNSTASPCFRACPTITDATILLRVSLSCGTYSAAGLFVDMSTVLRDAIFWIAVAFCAVAQLFIIRAVIRTAVRSSAISPSLPDAELPGAPTANSAARASTSMPVPRRSIEIAWAILPAALMIAAFVSAWRLMHPGTP